MREVKNHPSYGVLSMSRCSIGGDGVALFGSSIRHNDTIRLTISKATLERSDNIDRHYAAAALKDQYVEVEMSYTQFAEAITSLNMGGGVPVTVMSANGQRMEPCPFEDKQKQMRQEFKTMTREITNHLDARTKEIADILDSKKTLSKADREMIMSTFKSASMQIHENMPYVNELFAEQMEKTLTEAKGEFESFIQNKMNSIALAAISEQQQQHLQQTFSNALPETTDAVTSEEQAGQEQEQDFGITMGGL